MATLLINGTVVAGTGSKPVANAAVLIDDGGNIAYVGEAAGLAPDLRQGTVEIDVAGNTIFPGFIDCHVHLAFCNGTDDPMVPTFRQPRMTTYLKTVQACERTLKAGVTTVRDLMGMDLGFVLGIEQGLMLGPRMIAAVGPITAAGGHMDFRLPDGTDLSSTILAPEAFVSIVSGADEARNAARLAIARGALVIKITASGGVLSPYDSYSDVGLTLEEMTAIVDVANTHANGIRVAAHAEAHAGVGVALAAGVTSIEHGSDMTEDQIKFIVDHGIFVTPTLTMGLNLPPEDSLPPNVYAKYKWLYDRARGTFAALVDADAKLCMGTDSGLTPRHGDNLAEIVNFVDAGASGMQAIVAATLTAAENLQIDKITGSLETGKRADVVVAAGDASVDLEAVIRGLPATETNIKLVFKEGLLVADRLTPVA